MKINPDVLTVLSRAEVSDNRLVLPQHLDRKLYERTNKVLEAAGGRWSRKARAHLFDCDVQEVIDSVLLTEEIRTSQEFGYFPTPRPLVERLLVLAQLEPWMLVLEPSAGRGALAQEIAKIATVECFEIRPDCVAALEAGGYARAIFSSDFLSAMPTVRYDRVLMNPPFARRNDILHVEHALRFLKPDGLLVSVMSAGITFRQDHMTTRFREMVRSRGGWFEANPEKSFHVSGTDIRTVNVVVPGSNPTS